MQFTRVLLDAEPDAQALAGTGGCPRLGVDLANRPVALVEQHVGQRSAVGIRVERQRLELGDIDVDVDRIEQVVLAVAGRIAELAEDAVLERLFPPQNAQVEFAAVIGGHLIVLVSVRPAVPSLERRRLEASALTRTWDSLAPIRDGPCRRLANPGALSVGCSYAEAQRSRVVSFAARARAAAKACFVRVATGIEAGGVKCSGTSSLTGVRD